MKIGLDKDELFPVYRITDTLYADTSVDVSDLTLKNWRKTIDDYFELQKELGALYDANIKEV